MRRDDFTGTGTLFRLFIRRDRFLFWVWVVAPLLLAVATAGTFGAMNLETAMEEFISDPVISAMQGPVMSNDLAGVVVWRMMGLNVIILGIAGVLTVIRHTRGEEESGRSELIRAYVTGPYANLTAALMVALAVNLIAGLLQALLLMGIGGGAGGSVLFGLTVAAGGFFFACLGALGAQLKEGAGSAKGISLAAVGIGFLMMIINNGNGGYSALKWITPMAWHRLTQPLSGNHGWFLLLFIVIISVPGAAAFTLSKSRDLGAGIMPPRLGPAEAKLGLRSPLALAWRLHKGAFGGWFVGVGAFGAGIGAIAQNISENEELGNLLGNLGGTDWTQQVGNRDAFVGIIVYIISLAVALYAITAVLKSHKEEVESRGEIILAKPVSRLQWINSHMLIAFLASAVLMAVMGVGSGLIYGLTSGDFGTTFIRIFTMSTSKIPAIWIMTGITAFIYGFLPKAVTSLSFAAWTFFAAIELMWEGGIIDWSVMKLSPFSYAHYTIPVSELSMIPFMGLIFLSAILTGIGLLGLRNRDILSKA